MRDLFAEDLTIIEIDPDDEWGLDRNEGIGGSEAGSVLGLNKYHSALDLLEEKVTRTSVREFTEAQELRMACGHAQEALTLKNFATKELNLPYTTSLEDLDEADGLGHLSKHLFINPRFKFAFAHVDGLYRLNGELGIVDAKVSFRSPWAEVPEYYIAQLAHYNAVIGSRIGYIAAMFQDHPYPVPMEYRFDFTPEKLLLVMRAEAIFWNYVTKIRNGDHVPDAELNALERRLSELGYEFMDGIDTNPLKIDETIETIVVADEDKDLLVRYEELKNQKSLLMQEFETISTHFKGNTEAANVSFVTSDGTVLAKKATIAAKSLDRDAMVEAGVPVDKFFTTKPQARFTTTKALTKLADRKTKKSNQPKLTLSLKHFSALLYPTRLQRRGLALVLWSRKRFLPGIRGIYASLGQNFAQAHQCHAMFHRRSHVQWKIA